MDTKKIHHDLINGRLCFTTNIPIGYGLGSSGVLSSAIYYHYGKKRGVQDINAINNNLSEIESFFHGKSSGIDPLVSYFNKPIFMSKSNADVISQNINLKNIFLVDSGKSRSTKKLVKLFQSKLKNNVFRDNVEQNWFNSTTDAIKSILINEDRSVEKYWKKISNFQLKNMDDFIPDHIKELWADGINENTYHIKLCGAGGGGVFLVLGDKVSFNQQYPEITTYDL